MTIAQMRALYRLWARLENKTLTYREFRATAELNALQDCLLVPYCGMWVGIERDGYTHS